MCSVPGSDAGRTSWGKILAATLLMWCGLMGLLFVGTISAWDHHVLTTWQRAEATATGRVETELKDNGNEWFHHVERVRSSEIEYTVRGFKYVTFVEVSELPTAVVELLEMIAPPFVTFVAASELPAGSKHTILYNPDVREEIQFHLPSPQHYQFMGVAAAVCFMMIVAGFALYRMGRAKTRAATPAPSLGPPWSPPQELTFPTPRPIKGNEVVTARYTRIVGANLFFFGGMALFGWLFFGLSRAPGATIGAKWEQFREVDSTLWLMGSFVLYMILFLLWLWDYVFHRRVERLLKWRKPARAVVTHVQYRSGKPHSGAYWISKVEYHDDGGNPVKGWVEKELSENQVLTVLYDPDKPSECIVYPVAGYEIGEPEGS